ncbi:MAG TPA: hypothetical protein PLD59_06215, partial [Tepidisphaeraceae bacterium]|nr:hypothetical protein [Tepidisphaeraceae bacterium]
MTYDDPQYELIAYVEGALSPEQASQFEAKLAASESLREQLMLLKQADERLRYGFAAPGFVKIDFAAARRAAGVGDGAPTEPRRAN